MLLSYTNYVTTATGPTEDAAFPASNLATPQQRWVPAKTATAAESRWTMPFGVARTLSLIILVRANFLTARVQGNNADSWSSPPYDLPVTITQNPFNEQHQVAIVPVGFNYSFLSILVPVQSPIETPSTAFRLGGVWAGETFAPPGHFSVDFDHIAVQAVADVQPPHKGWRRRMILDNPIVQLRMKRRAHFTHLTPYLDDDAHTWMRDVDIAVRAAVRANGAVALYEDLGNLTMGWIVQPIDTAPAWPVNEVDTVENDWQLEEVS